MHVTGRITKEIHNNTMEKKFKRYHRDIGIAVCQRPGSYRTPGRRLCSCRHLCPLSATEKGRCNLHRRFGRTRSAHHHPRQEGRHHPARCGGPLSYAYKEVFRRVRRFLRCVQPYYFKDASRHGFRLLPQRCTIRENSSKRPCMQYYDEEAKTFLADRYITGECPHCHAEGAYGDQCEKCGALSLSPTDLINPKSAISGSQPVMQ